MAKNKNKKEQQEVSDFKVEEEVLNKFREKDIKDLIAPARN